MYRIALLNSISPAIYGPLGEAYRVSPQEDTPDGILVRSQNMLEMDIPESLLAVARAGAGVNNIPLERMSAAGVCVFNTPGANANAVCELVLLAMLLSCRDVLGGIAWERGLSLSGEALERAVEKGKSAFTGPELRGKTLGVIGLGAIGVRVANAAAALGMNVLGYDPMISVEHAWRLSRAVQRENTLDALFSACDFLTVHVPLNDKTRGLIGARAFSLCRKGVRVFNFSRAGLVDEEALIQALGTGTVARYVTDFGSERLLATEGVICMPHLGASTPESEENCALMAATQLRDYLEHGAIVNSVNLPSLELGPCTRPRLLCIHENVPNLLGAITSKVAAFGLNISDLLNRSRGALAVSALDLDAVDEARRAALLAALAEIPGMRRVRLLLAKEDS